MGEPIDYINYFNDANTCSWYIWKEYAYADAEVVRNSRNGAQAPYLMPQQIGTYI